MWKKLLLAFASFVVTLVLLEILTRVLLPVPAPIHYRDGIYANVLPMVNGRIETPDFEGISGPPLTVDRRDGELRIFVFGESSVAGAPWAAAGSAPTMLQDQLRQLFPERDFVVVNMGRSASYTIDALYYLRTIERYEPDIIIFYLGYNDYYDVGSEQCWAATHRTAYGIWQWAVRNSQLLWTVRARGPAYVGGLRAQPRLSERGEPCDDAQPFRYWSGTLIQTSRSMGAHVIVTTPIVNPLTAVEQDERSREWPTVEERLQNLGESYRDVLTCVLTEGCDSVPLIGAYLSHNYAGDEQTQSSAGTTTDESDSLQGETVPWGQAVREHTSSDGILPIRERIWSEVAEELGASLVNLRAELVLSTPEVYLSGEVFVDDMHLTHQGYWSVARLWALEVAKFLGSEDASDRIPLYLPEAAQERYIVEQARLTMSASTVTLDYGVPSLHHGAVVMGARCMLDAERIGSKTASIFLAWLRLQIGMTAAVPPHLAERVRGLDYEDFTSFDYAR